jgi:2-polyprenyl-6-methoxyphenol hydroxylase-like FAD-dependent oxidoreductase
LLRLLSGALAERGGTVHYGAEVADVRALDGYDVVVAADGLNSPARAALFGARHRTRYAGATAWRGAVDGDVDTVTETWGDGRRFGITPQEGGRVNWFACAVVPEGGRAPEGEVAALRAYFGDWHPAVRRVLDRLTEDAVLRHDLYDLDPPLPSYVRGSVALVGDAAHAMTPDLGRGACEALVDGVALATCLTMASTVGKGLTAYDAERRRPTQRLARMSRLVNRAAHARRLVPVRDAAVRLALAFGPPG